MAIISVPFPPRVAWLSIGRSQTYTERPQAIDPMDMTSNLDADGIHSTKAEEDFYRDVQDTEGRTVSLSAVLMGIKQGKWRKKIDELRAIQDEKKQKAYKNTLPCFTGSGVFKNRTIEGLVGHSGVLILDIDMKDNPSF